jgi:hypothetical protein
MTDLTAARWHKSTRSGSNGGNCVEVAANLPGIVAIRDSKNPTGPALLVDPDVWSSFVEGVKQGEFSI